MGYADSAKHYHPQNSDSLTAHVQYPPQYRKRVLADVELARAMGVGARRTHEKCERRDGGGMSESYAPACFGPEDDAYEGAQADVAKGYVERMHACNIGVRVERSESGMTYVVDGQALDERSFVEGAEALLNRGLSDWTGERLEGEVRGYLEWFLTNHKLYPYANTIRHISEEAPPIPYSLQAAHEIGKHHRAVKGLSYLVSVVSVACGPDPISVMLKLLGMGRSILDYSKGPDVKLAIGNEPMGDYSRAMVASSLVRSKTLNRYLAGKSVPEAIRQQLLLAARSAARQLK